MTNVKRPVHLQLRPASIPSATSLVRTCSPNALSPTSTNQNRSFTRDGSHMLPSQILPYLFVGDQEQTGRETISKLNISYILSLGMLPLISNSPTSPSSTATNSPTSSLPPQNSSKDFRIRLKTISNSASSPHLDLVVGKRLLENNCSQEDADENKYFKKNSRLTINCKCINVADNPDQIITKFFDEANQFIDEARRKKCNILVHCMAGISRSPTIAIAYLMYSNHSLRLQEAYNLVKKCRPQIDPNLSFMGQLMIYEKSLESRRLSCSSK